MQLTVITSRIVTLLALGGLLLTGTALAGDPVHWDFDVTTEGEDVFWTSPTAVDNTADRYRMTHEITLVEVTVHYLIFTFDVNVTDQVPPEFRSGITTVDGPLPVTILDESVVFPEPPEPTGFAATVTIGLDADGYGKVSLTDVILGQMDVEYPEGSGFYVTVDILAIRIVGQADIEPIYFQPGDMNCDEAVNAYDIDGFILAVSSYPDFGAYYERYPNCNPLLADANGDGDVNAYDIDGFIDLLGRG